MDTNEMRMVHQDGEISFYEIKSNRQVFAEQYQLDGIINGCIKPVTSTEIKFFFSGVVQMTITQAQLGHIPPTNGVTSLRWQVDNLLVILERQRKGDTRVWGSEPMTFEKTLETIQNLEGKNEQVKIAIEWPKFIFYETGDLMCIEGYRVVIKKKGESDPVNPNRSNPQQ